MPNKVGFVHSAQAVNHCSMLPKIVNRAAMVTSLIQSYSLLSHNLVEIIEPLKITSLQLADYHTKSYLETLQSISKFDDDDGELDDYGLEYDCPAFVGMYETVCQIAGATLAAAEALGDEQYKICINWMGGWHHARPDKAQGFCYINDCVLGIRELQKFFEKVLYVDIDLHHCDAVEDAFSHTPNVLTYSVHKHEAGFYPGSGTLEDIGTGRGKGYTVNIPLKNGAGDATLIKVISSTLDKVIIRFNPDVIVCQCGADGITGDPNKSFNYTPAGFSRVVQHVLGYNRQTLLLGGGGYNLPNTARTWCKVTADLLNVTISDDILDHSLFACYGPDYQLSIKPSPKRDENDGKYLDNIISTVLNNLMLINKMD